MEKIIIENKCCVFLNHQQLIEQEYIKHLEEKSIHYTLKPEIFNFKARNRSSQPDEGVKKENSKVRKRKQPADSTNEDCIKLEQLVEPYLKVLRSSMQSQCLPRDAPDMPRLWEDATDSLPQLRGANETREFQSCQFAQQTFIIPPKCKFYNYNVEDLPKLLPELETYDLIIMDMPWQNKYIKRLKRVKQSLAYKMLDNDSLKAMPVQKLINPCSLVALWCTNAPQHRLALEKEFLPAWNLKLLHCLKWFKLNTQRELIGPLKAEGYKQPYELLYIACHKDRNVGDAEQSLQKIDFFCSIPSIIHSHKPPLVQWLREYMEYKENFKGLEIFARYLQPNFTSIGLEVLKLMDQRLYNKIS